MKNIEQYLAKLKYPVPPYTILPMGGSQWASYYKLKTNDKNYFIKYASTPLQMGIQHAEYNNLVLLSSTKTVITPRIYHFAKTPQYSFILMDYIQSPKSLSHTGYAKAGRKLAQLHQCTSSHFGLDYDNYIGAIPQSNKSQTKTPSEHYIQDRIIPLLTQAESSSLLSPAELHRAKGILPNLKNIIPEEKPSLIHGDLWAGNLIASQEDIACFIDPACAYSIREMDIAMTKLFGGFPPIFYEAYQEIYPLSPAWQTRIPLFQLYYLLVHLLLFGISYKPAVMQCITPYE